MLVVQGLLLLTTPTANAACKVCGREGHNARTCPQRGTAKQLVVILGEWLEFELMISAFRKISIL
jgi:hypothetical protein